MHSAIFMSYVVLHAILIFFLNLRKLNVIISATPVLSVPELFIRPPHTCILCNINDKLNMINNNFIIMIYNNNLFFFLIIK